METKELFFINGKKVTAYQFQVTGSGLHARNIPHHTIFIGNISTMYF